MKANDTFHDALHLDGHNPYPEASSGLTGAMLVILAIATLGSTVAALVIGTW